MYVITHIFVLTHLKMTSMRAYLGQPNWQAIYALAQLNDGKQNFGQWAYDDGSHMPLFTEANSVYTVQLERSDSHTPYAAGIPYRGDHDRERLGRLQRCYKKTNNPRVCAEATLSNRFLSRNPFYEENVGRQDSL